ncbi:MAG: cytochrome C oxidase subunit IV family protein [Bacteroidota bacterium]
MGHDYETSKKVATKIILILAAITIGEVAFALLGKGYIIPGIEVPGVIMGLVMIILSAIKAYLIVYEFMHMKYEVPGLVKSVLLPTFLLVWAIVAFLWEGSDWQNRRTLISDKNQEETNAVPTTGMIYHVKESDLH